MKSQRQKHSSAFKAKVAIEALQERESISELSRKYGIHPNMISRWKKEFLERAPELFDNSDQDSQFTCHDPMAIGWIEFLEKEEIKISMDGKGRAIDNIFIERFWRSVKYDYVYISSYFRLLTLDYIIIKKFIFICIIRG